jgi:diguanylate cyclase (GGDEF)-like protein
VLLVIFPSLIEWLEEHRLRTAQADKNTELYQVASHILAGLSARYVLLALHPGSELIDAAAMLAVLTTAVVYIGLQRLLGAGQVLLLRTGTLRDSGIFDLESMFTDFVLALMGYIVVVLWHVAPWLIALPLLPLTLIYRALTVPQLKRAALTDSKTGLWNAGYTVKLLNSELARAVRLKRNLAIIMADLDLLRNINNAYGHLAGDVVLTGIGKLIRENIRQYDSAGRFGGEEFLIVLPEASLPEAHVIAERLRIAVEATRFPIATNRTSIHVTMSLGVAGYPVHAALPNALIHKADLAVYYAKLMGRNFVVEAGDVPESFSLAGSVPTDRLSDGFVETFVPRPE